MPFTIAGQCWLPRDSCAQCVSNTSHTEYIAREIATESRFSGLWTPVDKWINRIAGSTPGRGRIPAVSVWRHLILRDRMSFDAFVNRELWWLEGNCSLLEEAQDSTVPSLARLRSVGVVSANLDEFFMARVPALKRLARDRTGASSEGPAAQRMKAVAERVHRLVEIQQRCFFGDLRDRLAQDGILLLQPEALSRKQRYLLEEHFLA